MTTGFGRKYKQGILFKKVVRLTEYVNTSCSVLCALQLIGKK